MAFNLRLEYPTSTASARMTINMAPPTTLVKLTSAPGDCADYIMLLSADLQAGIAPM